MHSIRLVALSALLGLASAQSPALSRQSLAKLVDIGPTGIDIKRPVFAGRLQGAPLGCSGLYHASRVETLRLRRQNLLGMLVEFRAP